jgi:hypothetical protein
MPPKSRETLCAPRGLGKEFVLIIAAELAAIQKSKKNADACVRSALESSKTQSPRIRMQSSSDYLLRELLSISNHG